MARNFRRHRASHPIADLNVTNLIDLGFMLLIIFMVVASMAKQEQTLPVNLPHESASEQPKPNPDDKFETVTVKADGSFGVGARRVTRVELAREFAAFAKLPKPPVLRIRGDGSATLQYMVIVFDEMKKAGLTKFTIDTQVAN